jgi:hypothetical protein
MQIMWIVALAILMLSNSAMYGQETWVKVKGGANSDDIVSNVIRTKDGGFTLLINSQSADGDYGCKGERWNGGSYICHYNSNGDLTWKNLIGRSFYLRATLLNSMPDSGYIIVENYESDFESLQGRANPFKHIAKGGMDVLVMKYDKSGNLCWRKMIGGYRNEVIHDYTPTFNGGVVVAGFTLSVDGDFTSMNHGDADIFIVCLDSNGSFGWVKTIGGSDADGTMQVTEVVTNSTGDVVLTGCTYSNDGDFKRTSNSFVSFSIRLDSLGSVVMKSLGILDKPTVLSGVFMSHLREVSSLMSREVSDSLGNHVTVFYDDNKRPVLVRRDANGQTVWKRVYDGCDGDSFQSLVFTEDGGMVATGSSDAIICKTNVASIANVDILVVKFDNSGELLWRKTYGGRGQEEGVSANVLEDGSILIVGATTSDKGDEFNDGVFAGLGKGNSDIFLMKLDKNGNLQPKVK